MEAMTFGNPLKGEMVLVALRSLANEKADLEQNYSQIIMQKIMHVVFKKYVCMCLK